MESPRKPAVYEQILRDMRERILLGEFPAGSRLPSSVEVSRERGLSTTVVLQAYRRLEEEGLVQPELSRWTRVLALREFEVALTIQGEGRTAADAEALGQAAVAQAAANPAVAAATWSASGLAEGALSVFMTVRAAGGEHAHAYAIAALREAAAAASQVSWDFAGASAQIDEIS